MRIGIDVHAVERDGSGNCTYMRGLVQALAGVDHTNEYTLYGTDLSHPFYARLRALKRFELRALWPRWAPLRIPLGLAGRSILDGLDLLHVQYGGPFWLRGRLVSTIHDVGFIEVSDTFPAFERLWMPALIRATARRAALVLTGSEFARDQVVGWAGLRRERVRVTYNGIGPEFVPVPAGPARDAVLRRYGLRAPFVLSVGRLNARKNLRRLIEAFERLVVPGLQLAIGGPAHYGSDALRRRVEESPARAAIRCIGFIADPDLPAVMSGAAVFVYPSLFEGFGLPPLEAAACGTPVVASNTSALPEILGDAALLVDPHSAEGLASALRRALTDESLRAELRHRGIARAAHFSWEAVARRCVAAYAQAVTS